MGFSVSGATVVLFLGIFISFGVAYSAANNGFERVDAAYEEKTDDALFRQNTAIEFATVANEGGDLNVTVENTGSTTLSVSDTDIIVDGNYMKHAEITKLEVFKNGGGETDLWLPGETLHFRIDSASPSRVKVVTESGVAAAEVV